MKIKAEIDYGNCTETLEVFNSEEAYAAALIELELLCKKLGGTLIESIEY